MTSYFVICIAIFLIEFKVPNILECIHYVNNVIFSYFNVHLPMNFVWYISKRMNYFRFCVISFKNKHYCLQNAS